MKRGPMEVLKEISGPFKILVNYNKTVEEMVKDCKYDLADPKVNSKYFPNIKRGIEKINIYLIRFDGCFKKKEIILGLDKIGFRQANLPELLAFDAQYPDMQRKITIFALGATTKYKRLILTCWLGESWVDDNLRGRILHLSYLSNRETSGPLAYYAAVRK